MEDPWLCVVKSSCIWQSFKKNINNRQRCSLPGCLARYANTFYCHHDPRSIVILLLGFWYQAQE